jgi:hypothetical protein
MNSSNTIWEKHEMLCMRSKLGCFTRYISRFKQLYSTIMPRLAETKSESSQRDHTDNKQVPWAKIWNIVNKQVKQVHHKHKDSYLNQNKHISYINSLGIISKRAIKIQDACFAKHHNLLGLLWWIYNDSRDIHHKLVMFMMFSKRWPNLMMKQITPSLKLS